MSCNRSLVQYKSVLTYYSLTSTFIIGSVFVKKNILLLLSFLHCFLRSTATSILNHLQLLVHVGSRHNIHGMIKKLQCCIPYLLTYTSVLNFLCIVFLVLFIQHFVSFTATSLLNHVQLGVHMGGLLRACRRATRSRARAWSVRSGRATCTRVASEAAGVGGQW